MRPSACALTQFDWCPCKKRKFGHRETPDMYKHRGETIWRHSEKVAICKWKGRPQKQPNPQTTWSWTCSLQNSEKTNICCLGSPVMEPCYGSLSKLSVYFFVFVLLGVHWDSWIHKLMFSMSFGEFCHDFSRYFSFPYLFSLPVWDLTMCVLDFLILWNMSVRLCLFFFSADFLFFQLNNLYSSIFKFTSFFFCHLQPVAKPVLWA